MYGCPCRMSCYYFVLGCFLFHVILGGMPNECQKEGMFAFTYDQGPSPYTGILLTSLKKAGVKATFHVVPDYLDNPVLSANLRRAATEGHLIGLFVKEGITEDGIKDYLNHASNVVKKYINYQPQFLRFPSPGPSAEMLKRVTALGYKVTSFNIDSLDYSFIGDATNDKGEGSVSTTIKNVLDQIVPPTLGSFICVQRDIVQASVLQTPSILEDVKRRGYKPVRLDTCIGAVFSGGKDQSDKGRKDGKDDESDQVNVGLDNYGDVEGGRKVKGQSNDAAILAKALAQCILILTLALLPL